MRDDTDPVLRNGASAASARLPADHPVRSANLGSSPVVIEPLHTAVPGRARLGIGGLKGSEPLRHLLERGFAVVTGVRSATASALTGNLTVRYDPEMSLDEVIGLAARLLRGEMARLLEEPDQDGALWHSQDPEEIAGAFQTSLTGGLSEAAVRDRMVGIGPNTVPRLAVRSDLSIFAAQFQSLPVALLAGAAALSVMTGGLLEAAAILGVVAVNAVIGYRTESQAEHTIESLSMPRPQTAQVIRGGAQTEIAAEGLVPGDIVVLRQGMVVPADGRLVGAHGLSISEATLTGESLPVVKTSDRLDDARLPLGARTNMVYRGTIVTGGNGTAVVVATGARTEVGRIQHLVGATLAPETPIQRQLDQLGRQLAWVAAAAGGLLFGIGWLRGFALLQMVRSALSLAVAAVPEGLPMVATTTLALGVEEMRKLGILVRRLAAVETLASVQMVCFDKTGTLTLNRMSVTTIALGDSLYEARRGAIVGQDGAIDARADKRLDRLLATACLCSDAEVEEQGGRRILHGSATESALVQVALDRGVNVSSLRHEFPRLSVQHRSEAYRFMATTHDTRNGVLVAVKGSPAEVLARCRWEALPDGRHRELTAGRRARIEALNTRMARRALRVLGFAAGEPGSRAADGALDDLTWIGLMGLADPVRPGLRDLMRRLHAAGLRTVMLTGDQEATARAVAEEIGLNGSGEVRILDGTDLESLDASDLADVAQEAHAFARVGPAQKLRIVHALQASGSTVVMVGDGVNDSPALRAADIGIALRQDGAAAAAREVADIFLDTDDLNALVLAIERSRTIHTNIRKAIHYLLSTNSSEILLMLAATAAGSGAALSPVQLLWINLISDVLPGIGLALEPPEAGVMEQPPRPADDAIVCRGDMGILAREGAVLTAGALAAGAFGAGRHGLDSPQARTMTFGSLVAAQLLHALTCRSATKGVLDRSLPPNPALTAIMLGSAAAQSAALLAPGIRGLLGVAPLGAVDTFVAAAGGVLPFAVTEAWKLRRDSSHDNQMSLHFSRAVRPQRGEPARGDDPRTAGPDQLAPRGT